MCRGLLLLNNRKSSRYILLSLHSFPCNVRYLSDSHWPYASLEGEGFKKWVTFLPEQWMLPCGHLRSEAAQLHPWVIAVAFPEPVLWGFVDCMFEQACIALTTGDNHTEQSFLLPAHGLGPERLLGEAGSLWQCPPPMTPLHVVYRACTGLTGTSEHHITIIISFDWFYCCLETAAM